MNDVVLNKAEIIERSIIRVQETYAQHDQDLEQSFDAQDVIILNLQRACEACIDLAMHLVRKKSLGLPKDSREAFTLIERAGWIPGSLAESLRRMVAFRNIAVHDYRSIDWSIVRSIISVRLEEMKQFASLMIKEHGA